MYTLPALKQRLKTNDVSILAIDPGFALMGWSIIDRDQLVDYGVIETKPNLAFAARLDLLCRSLDYIIKQYNPLEVAIEKAVFTGKHKNAAYVQQAIGCIFMQLFRSGFQPTEYHQQTVKSIVCSGNSSKTEIRSRLSSIFNLDLAGVDDSVDAIAIGFCHVVKRKEIKIKKSAV